MEPGLYYTLNPNILTLTNKITVPPVAEGKLEDALKGFIPDPTQTELAVTGTVNDKDITALATFLKETSAPSITTRASMPSRVKTVGKAAFKGCTAMTEMFLHPNITSVGANAFEGCTALKALVFEGTQTVGTDPTHLKIAADVVKGTHADLQILLPFITITEADAKKATTYKKALGKPTYYYYNLGNYNDASIYRKLSSLSYKATVKDGSSLDDFKPSAPLGQ